MENKPKTPLQIMADALTEMTQRAMEAERQRDAAKEDAQNWYQNYLRKDNELNNVKEVLDAEIAEHQKTRAALTHALSPAVKGEG